MKTISCPACNATNGADEETCGRCGESLAMARLERDMQALREITDRMRQPPKPAFRSINGFGTMLLDYRPRDDGTYDATRWIIALAIPIVPLGAYHIQPVSRQNDHRGERATFHILGREPLSPARVARTYLLAIVGLFPLVWGWLNSGTVNRVLGGVPAFGAMLATVVFAAWMILFVIKNDGRAYRPATAA